MSAEPDLKAALEAADALISRLQDRAADYLSRKGEIDEAHAFYDLVEMLETAPEITTVRVALDRDPIRFGDPTPVSRAGHTG